MEMAAKRKQKREITGKRSVKENERSHRREDQPNEHLVSFLFITLLTVETDPIPHK